MLRFSSPAIYKKERSFGAGHYSPETRDSLIIDHLPKVKYIADRMASKLPPSVELDDIYGAGVIGLIDAVERFDESRGVAFTTFAEMRVRGAILDNLRSLDWASRSVRRRAREVRDAIAHLESLTGDPPDDESLAGHLKISLAEVRTSLQEMRELNIANLDECDQETGTMFAEMVADPAATPLDQLESSEQRHLLAAAIDGLPERERLVIGLYYVEELAAKEIAQVLGVTESRVSQLKSQASARLRAALQN